MSDRPTILYCHCRDYNSGESETRREVLGGLCASERPFYAVADLCGLAARGDEKLARIAAGDLRIAACYPRAVRWLFARCGAEMPESACANLRTGCAGSILEHLAGGRGDGEVEQLVPLGSPPVVLYEANRTGRLAPARRAEIVTALLEVGFAVTCTGGEGQVAFDADAAIVLGPAESPPQLGDQSHWRNIAEMAPSAVVDCAQRLAARIADRPDSWVPWFPAIDYDRCTGCGQCLNFCLFGTYSRDEQGRVTVANPQKCKTNCPACARVCPQMAIVFAKHTTAPINGDVVRQEDLRDGPVNVDLAGLAGGDIYSALRGRSGLAPGSSCSKGCKSLQAAAEALEIPPDLLNLPPEK